MSIRSGRIRASPAQSSDPPKKLHFPKCDSDAKYRDGPWFPPVLDFGHNSDNCCRRESCSVCGRIAVFCRKKTPQGFAQFLASTVHYVVLAFFFLITVYKDVWQFLQICFFLLIIHTSSECCVLDTQRSFGKGCNSRTIPFEQMVLIFRNKSQMFMCEKCVFSPSTKIFTGD